MIDKIGMKSKFGHTDVEVTHSLAIDQYGDWVNLGCLNFLVLQSFVGDRNAERRKERIYLKISTIKI